MKLKPGQNKFVSGLKRSEKGRKRDMWPCGSHLKKKKKKVKNQKVIKIKREDGNGEFEEREREFF